MLTGGAVGERQEDAGHVFAAAALTRQTFGDQQVISDCLSRCSVETADGLRLRQQPALA